MDGASRYTSYRLHKRGMVELNKKVCWSYVNFKLEQIRHLYFVVLATGLLRSHSNGSDQHQTGTSGLISLITKAAT